jgi:tetratricopeptide (TPR) repeat protein
VNPIFLCLIATSAQAVSDFRSANERALEGDLEGAISLYRSLLATGIDDADVHYNLGNAYAQAGKPIEAIVSYERALRRSPGDAEIADNLRFVRRKLAGEKEEQAPSLTLADGIEPVIAPLPRDLFGWIAGAANVLWFAAWFARRRSTTRGMRRALAFAMTIGIVVMLLGLSVVAGHWVLARDPRGVIVEKVELREGPHAKFKSKGAATFGGRVRAIDRAEDFIQVLQEDGTSGWVPAHAITRI